MSRQQSQSGFLLLEALIAIAIFSIGILGLMAMQGMVVRETTEAQYRIEASLLTNQLLGQMWTDMTTDNSTTPPTTGANLVNDYSSPNGPRYLSWRNEVIATATGGLPGAAATPPTVVFGGNNQVTVSIFWKQPGESITHQHVTITQLR